MGRRTAVPGRECQSYWVSHRSEQWNGKLGVGDTIAFHVSRNPASNLVPEVGDSWLRRDTIVNDTTRTTNTSGDSISNAIKLEAVI